MRDIHKNVIVLTIASILALLIGEAAVRTVLPRPGLVHPGPLAGGMIVPHESRHYTYTPNFTGAVTTNEYDIHVSINSIGLRDDPISPDTVVDVLAIGDSFTVGFGVEADEAWPSQLQSYLRTETLTDIRVVNAGVSGYSTTQIHLLLEELLHLDPKTVVLGLYPSRFWRITNPYVYWNGYSVLRSQIPRLTVVDGEVIRLLTYRKWLNGLYVWLAEHFYLGAYAIEATRRLYYWLTPAPQEALPKDTGAEQTKLAPLLADVALIHETLSVHGIRFLVLLINHQEKDGSFSDLEKRYNAIVKEYSREQGFALFDPLPYFESSASGEPRFRIGKDHHWSKEAHVFVARHLGAYMVRQRLLVPPPGETDADSQSAVSD